MQLLTVQQVQEKLAVSRNCVYALVAAGELPCVRIGVGRGTIRILESDLEDFIRKRYEPRPAKRRAKGKVSPSAFVHLDAGRLRSAWGEPG